MNPNSRTLFVFLAVLAAIAVIFVAFKGFKKPENPESKIESFEDCAKAGYPVMESYPRQCTVPSGRFFVEALVQEKPVLPDRKK